jgi:nitrate reductase NapD
MVISGIVMASRPEQLDQLRETVNRIEWADAHFSDSNGRLVVTIEAEGIDESMERLKELQQLPHVLMAEMSQYYIEDEPRDDIAQQ